MEVIEDYPDSLIDEEHSGPDPKQKGAHLYSTSPRRMSEHHKNRNPVECRTAKVKSESFVAGTDPIEMGSRFREDQMVAKEHPEVIFSDGDSFIRVQDGGEIDQK